MSKIYLRKSKNDSSCGQTRNYEKCYFMGDHGCERPVSFNIKNPCVLNNICYSFLQITKQEYELLKAKKNIKNPIWRRTNAETGEIAPEPLSKRNKNPL